MNQVTTYPPSPPTSTSTVPPSSPTAMTGASSNVPAIVGAIVVLAVLGALMIRVASKRAASLTRG